MKVNLVYLAAGNSRRFGTNKLLYEYEGKPLYGHLLDRLEVICARHPEWNITVVTQYPEIIKSCHANRKNIHTVFSAESCKGMSYSIRAALTEAGAASAYAFFVADQPYFTEKNAEAFLETMEQQQAALGCVTCGGRAGNPTWFSKEYLAELMELESDQGGRIILKRHPEKILYFSVSDEKELHDFDTIADLRMPKGADSGRICTRSTGAELLQEDPKNRYVKAKGKTS